MRLRGGLFGIVGVSCAALACTEPPPETPPQPRPLPVATAKAAPTAQVVAQPDPLPAPDPPPQPPQDAKLVRLPAPPVAYTLASFASVQSSGKKMQLVRVQASANAIIDVPDWFKQNRLSLPSVRDKLPADIPRQLGSATLAEAIAQPDGHLMLLYRVDRIVRLLAVIDKDQRIEGLFDFELYTASPVVLPGDERYVTQDLRWAAVDSGVLFVGHHHMTYAKSSGGLNGYITAIDMASGKMLWRSQPLVSNAVNFVIVDGHVISGYGFTAEPDFIYVLDAATGLVETKLPVNSAAEYFVLRDQKLYVRTYDTNYVYELRFKEK